MDKIFLFIMVLLFSFVPFMIYFDWKRVENNELVYINHIAYICKDNKLYTEKFVLIGKITQVRHELVKDASVVPVICAKNKIYKKEE